MVNPLKSGDNVVVFGRLWFNRKKGHTYCTAGIYVNGKFVAKTSYAYGYGQQYLWYAFHWLQENGYAPDYMRHQHPGHWCDVNGVTLAYEDCNVKSKGDL